MVTDVHRDEMLLILLADADIVLDAESIAATYGTDVAEWRASLRRLDRQDLVEQVGTGLYGLTAEGENRVLPRGPADRVAIPLVPSPAG